MQKAWRRKRDAGRAGFGDLWFDTSFGQIPFGIASDKYGRKRIIIIGLILFALGSFIAAAADTIAWVIIGRAVQGAGAISAAVTAFIADSTREEHRTKAMAMLGASIGITLPARWCFPLCYIRQSAWAAFLR